VARSFERTDGYLPIAAYGLIGDGRSAALVGVDGSVDWLCLPRFDDESVFGRILDAKKGGFWQLCPALPYRVHQRYRDRTNLLDTVFSTDTGVAVVTDVMPCRHSDLRQHARPRDKPRLVRLVECIAGEVVMQHTFDPRPDFARAEVRLTIEGRRLHTDSDELHLCVVSSDTAPAADSTFTLRAGDGVAFALRAGRAGRCPPEAWSLERAHSVLRETQQFWWQWISAIRYEGPYQQPVWRSALALKLMSYSPTGAIVAAPTTSLPEWIGGERNWDYRFTWLRDASFTLYAFFQLGMTAEANAFFHWLTHRHLADHKVRGLPNLFDVSGHAHTTETVLDHLEGYRGSRPVRVGNGAVNQLQLDVYGEILDSAYVFARFSGDGDPALWDELRTIVDLAIDRWEEPDSSIWEVRSRREHYTYSKLMCWVAVDRGLRIAERFKLPHDAARWKAARRAIHKRITTEGYSKTRRAFTQVLGGEALDAAMLRLAQVRFLPANDPRLRSTIREIENRLGSGVLLRRYRTDESEDGVYGDEGAFFMCSFWLVDALAHLGEVEQAERHFERLLTFSSPLVLFSEEVDIRTGELLGNYPQAFTHLALVGAAVNIERARHRQIGVRGL
jgi:GH15 family glucan-1,4-alpha-glucosidase